MDKKQILLIILCVLGGMYMGFTAYQWFYIANIVFGFFCCNAQWLHNIHGDEEDKPNYALMVGWVFFGVLCVINLYDLVN